MRYLATELRLVYPPISNQEGAWLADDPEVREQVASSKLYMIGHRAQLRFVDIRLSEDTDALEFGVEHAGSGERVSYHIPVVELLPPGYEGNFDIEWGEQLIRVWEPDEGTEPEVLVWFTPNKFLYDISHGLAGARGDTIPQSMFAFDLLYVGISKRGDSFTRLFKTGHEARLKILTNERQIEATARVSDEITLFFFDVAPIGIRYLDAEELEHTALGDDWMPTDVTVFADAEKAFVSLLKPRYNAVEYRGYPAGTDGLHGEGLERYAYAIREDLLFRTPAGLLRGSVPEGGYDVIVIGDDGARIVGPDQDETPKQ